MSRKVPAALDQEFEFDNLDLQLRGQSTFTQLVVWKLGELLATPLGSRMRRRRVYDLMDALGPYENQEYASAVEKLAKEQAQWKGDVGWEEHWQRSMLRALRKLMHDRDFDGPKDVSDADGQL